MAHWKKTFVSSFVAQVLSIVGFSFALPFLPFFIQDLGVADKADQAWWAGITLAATGFTLAVFAPIWGILADRYGRKKMVMRAMFGGAVILVLMSYSQNVYQLLVYRFLQGALTGTVSASVALVASVAPARRSGFALGMMQAAVSVGVATGPLLGGVVADQWGYRVAFRAGAVVVLAAGLLVWLGTRENFARPTEAHRRSVGFRVLLANAGFLTGILVLLSVRYANTIVNPSFPLVVKDIVESETRLNTVTGLVMAISGGVGAVSAGVLGIVGDRYGHRRIVIGCSLGAAVAAASLSLAHSLTTLIPIHLLFGMTVAGTMPAANAMIQRNTDPNHMGKAFGLASAISMMGLALGPLTGGYLASRFGIRVPFLAAGLCQLLVVAVVLLRKSVATDRVDAR